MTIKLGYANVKIYECDNPLCPRPERFAAAPSSSRGTFPCRRIDCDGQMHLVRHISFVDCPGHEILMQTMLNGAAVMDAAMLVVAADRPCPEPQTLYVPNDVDNYFARSERLTEFFCARFLESILPRSDSWAARKCLSFRTRSILSIKFERLRATRRFKASLQRVWDRERVLQRYQ